MAATLTGFSLRKVCGLALLLGLATSASAQQVVDPGFKSVGRGAPLSVAMPVAPIRATGGPPVPPAAQVFRGVDVSNYPFVGPMQLGGPPRGGPPPPGAPPPMMIGSAWNGAVPAGVQALPIDIFTSKDFYKDRELWKDKRYFRCNSPQGLELQRGAIFAPTIGSDPPRSAAWGYCDRDLPRSAMVSPYGFKTAQEHYDALMAETTKRGGPTQHTYATVPGEISGMYAPGQHLRQLVFVHGADAVPHGAVAADARIPDPPGAGRLPPGQYQCPAMGVAVLLARRLHAPLVCLLHPVHAAGGGVPQPGADHGRRGRQLHHQHPRGSQVPHGWQRAAPGTGCAALDGRDHRLLGQGRADHLDLQRAGLVGPRRLRVLEQDADDRDLHADPRRQQAGHRPESRGRVLRSGGAGRADPHHPQLPAHLQPG